MTGLRVTRARVARRLAPLLLASSLFTLPLFAQPGSSPLDAWIVTRFRGAQLLPDPMTDTTAVSRTLPNAALPRVESVRDGRGADTLVALHFDVAEGPAAMPTGTTARLASPTGTLTPVTARVVARRPFRAPRATAGSAGSADARWRYGWAYLAVLQPTTRSSPAAQYRGWLLSPVAP